MTGRLCKATLGLAAIMIGLFAAMAVGLSDVVATSMTPTLSPGDHLLMMRTPLMIGPRLIGIPTLGRGDIVEIRKPDGSGELIVKRIVAMGGDRVQIVEGLVFVNQSCLYEPYAHYASALDREIDRWPRNGGDVILPTRTLFVLGDNRSESVDSRTWGPVLLSDVAGRVIARFPSLGF